MRIYQPFKYPLFWINIDALLITPYLAMLKKVRENSWIHAFIQIHTKCK